MLTWPDRYHAGQYAAVWTEMLSFGASLRDDTARWDDARAVAAEFARRARDNVEQLVDRLSAAGYVFDAPFGFVHQSPAAGSAAQWDDVERTAGVMPLALRTWLDTVGLVDLTGHHPDLAMREWDPLVVMLTPESVLSDFADWTTDRGTEWDTLSPFAVDFAPDRLHKAGISGGGPYGLRVPDGGADGLVIAERHQTTFNNYVRISFASGGFPGWSTGTSSRESSGQTLPPVLAELGAGLGQL